MEPSARVSSISNSIELLPGILVETLTSLNQSIPNSISSKSPSVTIMCAVDARSPLLVTHVGISEIEDFPYLYKPFILYFAGFLSNFIPESMIMFSIFLDIRLIISPVSTVFLTWKFSISPSK
ncbi:hypothetical protein AYI69_g3355 [Smittium culicis]|uniref:Uncharacterized protein n=1 Tax=Smittium culicis TaxID=133412 RepID=A0A1R1YK01_9FUNG|nr:hypothetical protein AYI69_g3355 [Smittium culicis]